MTHEFSLNIISLSCSWSHSFEGTTAFWCGSERNKRTELTRKIHGENYYRRLVRVSSKHFHHLCSIIICDGLLIVALIVTWLIILSIPTQTWLLQTERSALEAIYAALNGDAWTEKTNWNSPSIQPCDDPGWGGIVCTGGSVTDLDLNSNNLSGSIPTEIGYLSNLVSQFM